MKKGREIRLLLIFLEMFRKKTDKQLGEFRNRYTHWIRLMKGYLFQWHKHYVKLNVGQVKIPQIFSVFVKFKL